MSEISQQSVVPESVRDLFPDELVTRLLALRRDLHQHPELSLQENRTAERLYDELSELQPKCLDRVFGTGIVAVMKGRDSGRPVVAVRGDIDALPIQEDTGVEWTSVNPGVMHACGHDVHAVWAIGAAHLLAARPAAGDVVVVLQPAEEISQGAQGILESGALAGVRAIFGGHADRRFAVGEVVAQAGPLAAASDRLDIELLGRGAHGARPHEGRDPVVGLANLINALQTIVSRRLNPAIPGVVTIGMVEAGNTHNVIPEKVVVKGTLRSMDAVTRNLLHTEVERITRSVGSAHDLETKVEIARGAPPLLNSEEAAGWACKAVTNVLGREAVVPLGFTNMAGEDFAFYLEQISGCFMRIGAREEDGRFIPGHSPKFYAADESIFVGAAVLAECVHVASAAL